MTVIKNEMHKTRVWRVVILTLFLVLLGGGMSPAKASAASSKTKALKAYQTFLKKNSVKWNSSGTTVDPSKCEFAIAYIDKNSVPELVLHATSSVTHVSSYYALYTYRNGKVVWVANMTDAAAYYKKKGVYTSYTMLNGEYEAYYQLSKATSTIKLRTETYYTTTYYNAETGTQLTESAFNAQLKNLVGSKKLSQFKFHKNTKKNRAKYL